MTRTIEDLSSEFFPEKDANFLWWICWGVYYGYPAEEIVSFCKRMEKGQWAPKGTSFSGTGYILSGKKINLQWQKNEHVSEINARRYAKYPFPREDKNEKREEEHMRFLFATEFKFLTDVFRIARSMKEKKKNTTEVKPVTRHRDLESFDNLVDILKHLGDSERTGKKSTWVAKNYSLSQLIKDLQKIKDKRDEI